MANLISLITSSKEDMGQPDSGSSRLGGKENYRTWGNSGKQVSDRLNLRSLDT